MSVHKIGSLLRYEREEKNISRERICQGLCAEPMLLKIEENKCETDKLLLDILFQRLGKSPDKLEIIISLDEYTKISARDDIDELICKRKYDEAAELLEAYIIKYEDTNAAHKMYYYRTKSYILLEQGKYLEAKELMEKALELTMPGWENKHLSEYYISTYEMENLLVYGVILCKKNKKEVAIHHIEKCLEYINIRFNDREERAKIYPKCIYELTQIYNSQEDDERITNLCEEALLLLRKESISYFMMPLMEQLICRYKRLHKNEKANEWEKYYKVMNELYEELEVGICRDYLFFRPYQCEIHLDYETIKGERLAKGITQEKLIEDVYSSAETLSRIENAVSSPTKRRFEALMDKLDVDKTKYNTFMVSTSFAILEMKNELDDYLEVYDIASARDKLEEIERSLDVRIAENRRFVDNIKNTLDRLQGRIDDKEALDKAIILLKETYDYEKEQNRPPMRNEAVLLAQIVSVLEELGYYEKANYILEKIIKKYKCSAVKDKYRIRSYMLLCGKYEKNLYSRGDIYASNKYARERMKLEFSVGKGSLLGQGLLIWANNMLDLNIEERRCKDAFKRTYILHKLFLQEFFCSEIADYYNGKYNEEIY